MLFTGITRTFSTENEQQYETIGAFWAEMENKYDCTRLRGLGYNWTPGTIEYVIGLTDGYAGPKSEAEQKTLDISTTESIRMVHSHTRSRLLIRTAIAGYSTLEVLKDIRRSAEQQKKIWMRYLSSNIWLIRVRRHCSGRMTYRRLSRR